MSETMRPKVGVGVYICHGGKVLVIRRIAGHGKDSWTVPGGHQEFGEHWFETAVREAKEEVGMEVHSPELFCVSNEVYPEGKHYITLHVAVKADHAAFKDMEPEKQVVEGWLEWDEFPRAAHDFHPATL